MQKIITKSLILSGWNSLGPSLLTKTIRDYCFDGQETKRMLFGYHEPCDTSVLQHSSFYPIKHPDLPLLFQSNSDQVWEYLFRKSYSVHFYGFSTDRG